VVLSIKQSENVLWVQASLRGLCPKSVSDFDTWWFWAGGTAWNSRGLFPCRLFHVWTIL